MESDSSNSVSVGLGQLVVEGKGLVGTVEYTLLETTTPSGSTSSDLTVADVLFGNGGPDSARPDPRRRVVPLLDRRRGPTQSDARATPEAVARNSPALEARPTTLGEIWRRRPESNRRIEVLQTSALPLGYAAFSR